jgi:hypothetical protein
VKQKEKLTMVQKVFLVIEKIHLLNEELRGSYSLPPSKIIETLDLS